MTPGSKARDKANSTTVDAFDCLVWGYEKSLRFESSSGSWDSAAKQLQEVAARADEFASALSALNGIALEGLFLPTELEEVPAWRAAGGNVLLKNLKPLAESIGIEVDDMARRDWQGCLLFRHHPEQLKSLGVLCRSVARRYEERGSNAIGVASAARDLIGSPTQQLARNAVKFLMEAGQPTTKLKQLMRLVHEAVTGEPPPKRWAEREVKAHTDPH